MAALEAHPNLVKMLGLVVDNQSGEYSLVVQFCPGGSLDTFLAKPTHRLDEYATFKLIYGITSGCESLARSNVIHRDLAARNILLGERNFPKVADFGYSRRVDLVEKKGATNSVIGPIPWMSPEQIRDRVYSEKSDVWALGATIVEIVTAGAKPYAAEAASLPSMADLAVAIRDSGITPLDTVKDTIQSQSLPEPPAWVFDLLKLIFKENPADRPTFHQLRLHMKKLLPELAVKYENELDLASAIIVESDDAELESNLATREYSLLSPGSDNLTTKKSKKTLKTAKSKRKSKLIDPSMATAVTAGPKFKILAKLGEGSFGVVSLGVLESGRYVAVKQVLGGEAETSAMYNESKIMLSLKPDRNVIQVFGLTLEGDKLAIVLEFAAFGSLDSFVEKTIQSRGALPAQQLFRFAIGIARGMASLASQHVVHRDLAARNVLLDSNLEPKVADFGLSRSVTVGSDSGKTVSNTGPVRWMAPESLDRQYSEKSDVWAYGCTLFELATGMIPYPEQDLIDVAVAVRDKGLTPISDVSSEVAAKVNKMPEYLVSIMKMCFAQKPESRPTFAELVKYLTDSAPKSVLRVEEKRKKRKEKREKILQAIDEIAL